MKKIFSIVFSLLLLPTLAFAQTFNVSINGDICWETCSKAVSVLKKAGKGDTVNLSINTYGGSLDPYYAMKRALNGEKLKIYVNQRADSAGSFMLMLSPYRHVPYGSEVIFHTGHAVLPNGSQIKFSVYSNLPWIKAEAYRSLRLLGEFRGLFTDKEWETLRRGDDVRVSPSRLNTI